MVDQLTVFSDQGRGSTTRNLVEAHVSSTAAALSFGRMPPAIVLAATLGMSSRSASSANPYTALFAAGSILNHKRPGKGKSGYLLNIRAMPNPGHPNQAPRLPNPYEHDLDSNNSLPSEQDDSSLPLKRTTTQALPQSPNSNPKKRRKPVLKYGRKTS